MNHTLCIQNTRCYKKIRPVKNFIKMPKEKVFSFVPTMWWGRGRAALEFQVLVQHKSKI